MTKLFVQLLLSVIIGLGAAMGFNPKVRADVHGTMLQANASLHETVNAAAANTNKVTANTNSAVSVKANTNVSSKASAKVDLNLKSELQAKTKAGNASPVNGLPNLSVSHSLTNGTQGDLEVDGSRLDVGVKDKAKSTLNLDLGTGK